MTLRRWRHWTLRSRLVLMLAALTAAALLAANAAGLLLLRDYLTDRVDEQLHLAIRPYASGQMPVAMRMPRPPPGGPGQAVAVFDAEGTALDKVVYGEDLPPPQLGDIAELTARAASGRPYAVGSEDGGDGRWRVLVSARPDGGVAVVAVSLRDVDATAEGLLLIDAVVMGIILIALGVGAALVVRVGLRPLTRMEATSAAIAAGDLDRRVDDTDPHTEPGRLGTALNTMLDRIGQEMAARTASERRLRQFVADASHELRTPLTSIRGFAELYRRGGTPPGPELDETMARIEAEAARMGLLVEDLLLLARLDQERPLQRSPTDLLAIAADTVRDAYARTPTRSVRLAPLDEAGAYDPVTVLGDEHRLRQVAANLVTNALRHTPTGGRVTVRVGRLRTPDGVARPRTAVGAPGADRAALAARGAAVLEVADEGPGIPDAHVARVFERLYRVDQSRTRVQGAGSGLGLSIVAAIVHSHGGCVELLGGPGRGATFRVLLPVDGPSEPVNSEPIPS